MGHIGVHQYSKSTKKKRPPLWTERLDWAYSQPLTNPSRVSVLVYLVRRADKDGVCWPTIELISSDTKISEKTVRTSIKVIEACGLVYVTRIKTPGKRKGRTGIKNRYQLQYTHTTTSAAVQAAESPRPNGNGYPLVQNDQTVTVSRPSGNGYRVSNTGEEATCRGADTTEGVFGNFGRTKKPAIFRPDPVPAGPWFPPWSLPAESESDDSPESLQDFVANGGRLDD